MTIPMSKSFIHKLRFTEPEGEHMKAFRATGAYKLKMGQYRNETQDFKVEVAAADEKAATQKIYSDFGSRHRVERKNIRIDELVALKDDEITDPVVRHLVGGAK